jgi:proteasome regulatory subunit
MSATSHKKDENIDISDYPRYLLDRMRLLEERNNILKEQKEKIEFEKQYVENQKLKYEREVRELRSELEQLKTPPLLVGTVVDVLKGGKVIISSSTGPQFVVNASQFIKREELLPGTRVSLNHQTLAIVGVLPSSSDPLVSRMEVSVSTDVSFADIGGLDEQIRELKESVELPLVKPELFSRIGITPPKGVLLYGPPGTGKTMLAKAVARETKATFIRIVGSELVQKYIGEGARLVREVFEMAKKKSPSIIFIDELDSIGAKRFEAATAGDREVQRTLMQLLAEMDGFSERGDVRIIAATNRPDILDEALLRPGRFDRLIEVPTPDEAARESIFRIHSRGLNLSEDVDFSLLAKITEGLTGADIRAIVMEAGMFAVRAEKERIELSDFQQAVRKITKMPDGQKFYVESMFV